MSEKLQLKEKIDRLIKSEGISQSRMAEILEIQPAGVSHLLAGRNKPGFDLLQKILLRFPRINPDWLLLDSANMYRDATDADHTGTSAPAVDRPLKERPAPNFDDLFSAASSPLSHATAKEPAAETRTATETAADRIADNRKTAEVVRVVVFYDDHSFESFTPKH